MAFPSTFADIYGEVINRVRLNSTADLQKAKDWVNQVYAEVCVETEAIQDDGTMSLTAGENTYTLDAAIIRIKQMFVTPSGQPQSRPLTPTSVEQILEWSAGSGSTSQATVTHYALLGTQKILFYPTPLAADTITIYYVKLPTALSGTTDVPVLQEPYSSNLLVEGACYEAAMFLKDPDAMLYKQNYEQSLARFRGHLRRKEGSMTRQFRFTGGDVRLPHDPSVDRGR